MQNALHHEVIIAVVRQCQPGKLEISNYIQQKVQEI